MLPNIGLIGVCVECRLLVPLLRSAGYTVHGVWDKSYESCQKFAAEFNISFYTADLKDLLVDPNIELVYIAAQPSTHAEIAVKALSAGKHVICQKPPSIIRAGAEKMVSLSRYYSQLLSSLASHLRFLPTFVKMRELLLSGYCGDLLAAEVHVVVGSLIGSEPYGWKCDSEMGGGLLNIVGAHIVDILNFLTAQKATDVSGFLNTFVNHTPRIQGYRSITSDDFCTFQLRCSRGMCASVTLNSLVEGENKFEISVTGSLGRLQVVGRELISLKFGKDSKEEKILTLQYEKVDEGYISQWSHLKTGFYETFIIGSKFMFEALRDAFDHTTGQLTPRQNWQHYLLAASFEDGLYIRLVLDAIKQSHNSRQWVRIELDKSLESHSYPFWTGASLVSIDSDKPSPKLYRPLSYAI